MSGPTGLHDEHDGVACHTEKALQWAEDINQRGLRDVIADRDRPWQDYAQQR